MRANNRVLVLQSESVCDSVSHAISALPRGVHPFWTHDGQPQTNSILETGRKKTTTLASDNVGKSATCRTTLYFLPKTDWAIKWVTSELIRDLTLPPIQWTSLQMVC